MKVVPVVLLVIQLKYGQALNGAQENKITINYTSPDNEYLVLKDALIMEIIAPWPCPSPSTSSDRPNKCHGHRPCPDRPWPPQHDKHQPGHHYSRSCHGGGFGCDRNSYRPHLNPNAVNASCKPIYNPGLTEFPTHLISHSCNDTIGYEVTVLQVSEVTGDMSTLLMCTISKDIETFHVEFKLKVKAGKRVWVEEDEKELQFVKTDLSTTKYDGFYMYRFVDGKFVNLTCTNKYQTGFAVLEYHNGGMLLKKDVQKNGMKEKLLFQRIMRSEDIGSYIDCIHVKYFKEYPQNFTYRTYFIKDYFLLSVDDTNTTQMHRRTTSEDTYYVYNYVKGGNIKFTCEKINSVLQGKLSVNYDKKNTSDIFVKEITHTDFRVTVLLNTEHLEGRRISCNSGNLTADTILFQRDTSHDGDTTIIIICVIIPLMAIIATLSVYYWCKKTRSTDSVQRLNESISQFNTSTGPNPLANIDDYDYTYIENEYNYIGSGSNEYIRENSLYRGKSTNPIPWQRNALPRESNATISLSNGHTDNNYCTVLNAKLKPTVNNIVNPTSSINYGNQDIGEKVLPTNTENYENVHEENNKFQKEGNYVNYRYGHHKPLDLRNNIFEDNKETQKVNTEPIKYSNIIRYSNLLKGNNVLQQTDEKPKENNK